MRDGNMLIGWGMATSTYPTHRMPAAVACAGRCERHSVVQVGTQDIGTGTYTVMSQIAADGSASRSSASGSNLATVRFRMRRCPAVQ